MIYVTVGTTPFEGLVRAADDLKIDDEIVIQKADGKYVPKNHEYHEYSDKYNDYLKKADVVVTHGGAGTLFKLIGAGKRVVGVANEERIDLHQWDILKKLSDEGDIIWCQDLDNLAREINKAKKQNLKRYTSPESKIATEIIEKFYA